MPVIHAPVVIAQLPFTNENIKRLVTKQVEIEQQLRLAKEAKTPPKQSVISDLTDEELTFIYEGLPVIRLALIIHNRELKIKLIQAKTKTFDQKSGDYTKANWFVINLEPKGQPLA